MQSSNRQCSICICILCILIAGCTASPLPCESDQNIGLTKGNRYDVFLRDGDVVIVWVRNKSDMTIGQMSALVEPTGGGLTCVDAANSATPPPFPGCFFVRIPANMCPAEAKTYFSNLGIDVRVDVPDPDMPCDCEPCWECA